MKTVRLVAVAASALAISLAACHRARLPAPAPAVMEENACWWAVIRTGNPVDTVTARFARAFADLGFASLASSRIADTAWVNAAPSVLPGYPGGAVSARVVAYRLGDSTHFRTFIATPGWTGAQTIPLCQAIARTAAVGAVIPRNPDGEELLGVWQRRGRRGRR